MLGSMNVYEKLEREKQDIELRVFLKKNSEPDKIRREIKDVDNAKKVICISKSVALRELIQEIGDSALIKGMDENPLPTSFRVVPERKKPHILKAMQGVLLAIPGVDKVVYSEESVTTLFRTGKLLSITSVVVGVFLFLASLLSLAGGVGIRSQAKRQEMEMLSLFGISKIQSLFIFWSFIDFLINFSIALGVSYWIYRLISLKLNNFIFFPPIWVGGLISIYSLLGIIIGSAAIRKRE
jgi:cell division protein FtsX